MFKAVIFVLGWFALALSLAISGWFEQFPAPVLFGFGAIASATGFAVLYSQEHRFRQAVPIRDLKRLTWGQTLRFFGTLALIKAWQHVLPPLFAIPTGLMDLAIAGSSFQVAARLVPARGQSSPSFFYWHIAGLATLAISNILVFLTATPRFGLVDANLTSQSMARFPMSMVPTFIGPLVLIFHLLAIFDGRRHAKMARLVHSSENAEFRQRLSLRPHPPG